MRQIQPFLGLLRRRLFWNALFWAAVALFTVSWLTSEEGRAWLWAETGEENLVEGVKGIGALAYLSVQGPKLDLQPDVRIEQVNVIPYGVNTFLQLEPDPENVRKSFEKMRDSGIKWARQQFPWEDIEIHGRGDYEDRRNTPKRSAWDKYDLIVDQAGNYGVNLLVRLDDPPAWAFADPKASGDKGPPDSLDDYGKFVATVVKRYCGRVRYFQIWNEPNIYPEWGERDVDPAGYAALLKLATDRARGVCPGVVIVSAAMAPTTEPGGRNMDDLKYLEALYAAGWAPFFDILAANAYGLWTGPTDRRVSRDRANFSRPMLARDLMVRSGDAAKPIWFSEMGWDSPPLEMAAPYGRVSEANRARYTLLAYERMAEEWPWAGVGFLWFLRRPDREWQSRPEGWFRLLEPEWEETPAFTELSAVTASRPVLHRGRHRADDPAPLYTGPWRNAPLEGPLQQKVGAQNAELQVAFQGTGFGLSIAPSPTRTLGAASPLNPVAAASVTATGTAPRLTVIIDGELEEPVLAKDEDRNRFVYNKAGLEPSEHAAIVRVDEGELWLDELIVKAPERPWPFWPVAKWAGWVVALLVAKALLELLVRRVIAYLQSEDQPA